MVAADPEVLARAAELLGRCAEDLLGGLSALDGEVSAMLSGWQGASGGAYELSWQLWHGGASRVHLGLSMMAGLLDASGAGYQHQDESSASVLDGVAL